MNERHKTVLFKLRTYLNYKTDKKKIVLIIQGTLEKMGQFKVKKLENCFKTKKEPFPKNLGGRGEGKKASAASYHGRAQRAATGERSELPRASAASCQDERSEPATFY